MRIIEIIENRRRYNILCDFLFYFLNILKYRFWKRKQNITCILYDLLHISIFRKILSKTYVPRKKLISSEYSSLEIIQILFKIMFLILWKINKIFQKIMQKVNIYRNQERYWKKLIQSWKKMATISIQNVFQNR